MSVTKLPPLFAYARSGCVSWSVISVAVFAACVPRASAQMFENTTIDSRKLTSGGQSVYQISGNSTASNIPLGAQSVTYKFEFQRNEGGIYKTQITVDGSKIPSMGSASIDTGWINFNPQAGEQWRAFISGFYTLNNQKTNIADGLSNIITPIP